MKLSCKRMQHAVPVARALSTVVSSLAIRLNRKAKARFDQLAIDDDRARTANSGFATSLGTREIQVITNEISQKASRRNSGLNLFAIDREMLIICSLTFYSSFNANRPASVRLATTPIISRR